MIPSLVSLIQEPGLSEDAKRQGAHALSMLAAEDRFEYFLLLDSVELELRPQQDGPCDAVWQAGAGPPLLSLLKDSSASQRPAL